MNTRLRLLDQEPMLLNILHTLDLQDPRCNSSKGTKSNWRTLQLFFLSVSLLLPISFGPLSVLPSPFSPGASCPLLPVPAEFFHPAISATQTGPEKVSCPRNLPKISLQGSWASLRSPSVNCSLLHQVRTSASFCEESLIFTPHPEGGEQGGGQRKERSPCGQGGAQWTAECRRDGEERGFYSKGVLYHSHSMKSNIILQLAPHEDEVT